MRWKSRRRRAWRRLRIASNSRAERSAPTRTPTTSRSPGERRTLTVHVRGTPNKIALEAHNLAPDVADLDGGNPARVSSSGGEDNLAQFQLVGKQRGNFVVSIRLLAPPAPPQPPARP